MIPGNICTSDASEWETSLSVFETVPDLYLIISGDLRIITASDAYLKETSLSRPNIQGRSVEAFYIEETGISAEDLTSSLRSALTTGGQHSLSALRYDAFTRNMRPAEAGDRYWTVTNTPVLDENGKIRYIIHKVEDASERIRNYRELEELRAHNAHLKQQEHYMAVVENIPDVVTRWNEDLQLIYANAAFESKAGFCYKALLGKTAMDMGPEEHAIPFMEKMRQVFADGQPRTHFTPIAGPGGEMCFYSRLVPEKDEHGKVKSILRIARDITDLKQAEEKVKESRDFLQSVIDASLSTISVRKAVRDEQGKIIDFEWVLLNEQAKTYWNRRDLVGERQSIMSDLHTNSVFEKFVHTVESGVAQTFEQDFFIDGAVTWVMINVAKLNDGLIISSMDITRRKLADQQLKQNNGLLKSIFNSAVLGVCVYSSVRDEKGTIIDFEFLLASQLTEELLGRGNLIGVRLLEMYPEIRNTEVFEKMVAVVDRDLVLDEAEELTHFGQAGIWVRCRAIKMEDGLIISWLDISKQKNVEQQLVKQYRILKQAEDVAAIGSWEFEIPENKMSWSEGMFDLFGLKKEAYVYPELYLKYIIPEDKSRMKDIIRLIKQEFKPFQDEVRLKIGGRNRIFRIKAAVSYNEAGTATKVTGVAMDITERSMIAKKLKQIEEIRFQDILHAVVNAQEEERTHIAEMLHNEFGQLLSVAKMKITGDNLEAADLLNQAILQVRSIAYDLMPDILSDFGLEFALKDMCDKKLSDAGIKYSVKIRGLTSRIKPVIEVAIYRIVQELLNNLIKHSQADMVTLEVIRKQDMLHVQLYDNGIGFYIPNKTEVSRTGFGLRYILNRVELHKGRINVNNQEKGTSLTIELPLPEG